MATAGSGNGGVDEGGVKFPNRVYMLLRVCPSMELLRPEIPANLLSNRRNPMLWNWEENFEGSGVFPQNSPANGVKFLVESIG